MLALLAGALLLPSQEAPAETVRLAGRDVPVLFPTGPVALPPLDQAVRVGDRIFAVNPDGTLGPWLDRDGWARASARVAGARQAGERRPYVIKLIVFTRSYAVELGIDGVVRQRRAGLTDSDVDAILQAAANLKALLETATDGALRVRIEAEVDDDAVMDFVQPHSDGVVAAMPGFGSRVTLQTEPREDFFGPGFVARNVAARVNDGPFENDDDRYYGPFDSVIVVHPGLTDRVPTYRLDQALVTLVPYFGFSDRPVAEALPVQMLEIARQHLGVRAGARLSPVRSGVSLPLTPYTDDAEGLAQVARLTRAIEDSQVGISHERAVDFAPVGGTRVASVRSDLVPVLESTPLGRAGGAWVPSADGVRWRVPSDSPSSGDLAVLGASAAPLDRPSAQGYGAFTAAEEQDAERGEVVQVSLSGPVARGGAVVPWSGQVGDEGGILEGWVKLEGDGSWAINLHDMRGVVTTSVVLQGPFGTPAESPQGTSRYVLAPVAAGEGWTRVTVPVLSSDRIGRVTVGGPLHAERWERRSLGPTSASVAGLTLRPREGIGEAPSPSAPTSPLTALVSLSEPLDDGGWRSLADALGSSDAESRLTALHVLTRIREPRAHAALAELATSGFPNLAWAATRALAYQGTPEAVATLRQIVERGPFDTNRRFAVATFRDRPDPAMAASLSLMAARPWSARYEGVMTLGAIEALSAQVILSAVLSTEPEPAVRLAAVRGADPKVEIVVRRLLYLAVNDPSQWVRAAALAKCVDSPVADVREEALRTRDDAVSVRLAVLATMAAAPDEKHRPALRLAVADPDPAVRAAALDALAAAPGPVSPDEVANVFRDGDPRVKAALARLAEAKGFTIP